MQVRPAHFNQLLRARDGRLVEIDQDAGNVAADLKRIDPQLRVRFAEDGQPPFWAVYHESDDGRATYLVLTAEAHQTASGIWAGLDQRIVRRVAEIGDGSYDYARDLERTNNEVTATNRRRFRDRVGAYAEEAAHAIHRDLGHKGRIFKP